MRCSLELTIAAFLLIGSNASDAAVWIKNDRGGLIEKYLHKYDVVRESGQSVIIDGLCASACTIVLTIPWNQICVTPQAKLAFHAAWDFGPRGRPVTNLQATQKLYSLYPKPVQQWIADRGGLTSRTIILPGKVLKAMYRPC
ncbi:hypothetical protein CI1B_20200 [Bradyrhizobium ivorense]|uniref:Uncharacterized protein n=1 Tax=Bradyrhizobium ivorense TaxID=2511166 RepID=A0A508T073_9BRAD|nr:hypothetical protein [Bradyrhizobium ivorense]VIO68233.1 hypothetical protein CI1B_20200 [Bradyrhizobium ivorense]